jgi:hypothetical protein
VDCFLWAVFVLTAALNVLHIRAGFFTNYAADLVVPALLYVGSRGLASPTGTFTLLRRRVGATPERAALVWFLASASSEWSQRYWPHGLFPGRFDPWDIVAFGSGIAACYALDKWGSADVSANPEPRP